jgi:hypothetical protein
MFHALWHGEITTRQPHVAIHTHARKRGDFFQLNLEHK